jgi:hypothetical protein
MVAYDKELVSAAKSLVARQPGQRGKISDARIRRSISTSYYALYHFLSEEIATRLIGSHNALRRRRRIFVRSLTHAGIKAALEKFRKPNVDQSVADFMRGAGGNAMVASPPYTQNLATAFCDSQAKRHDADYNLNEPLSERDAKLLAARIENAINDWRAAITPVDRDFKHALCMLMLLKGNLREK